jgi:hypothetical protein
MREDACPAVPQILDYASEPAHGRLRNLLSPQLLVGGLGVAGAMRIISTLLVVAAQGAVHNKIEFPSVSYGVCYLGWRFDRLPHWMIFGAPVAASILWARLTIRVSREDRRAWEERLIATAIGLGVLWLATAFVSVALLFACLCQPLSKPGVFPW